MATALKLIDVILSNIESWNQVNLDINPKEEEEEKMSVSDFVNYLAIESVGGANFHPKSNEIVFVYNACGIYQVYQVPVKPNQEAIWPQRLTYSKDRCTNPQYLSDGTIVFVSDKGGNEHFQLYLIDTTNKTHKISSNDLQSKHQSLFTTSNYLYYTANIEDKSKFDVYRQRIPVLNNKAEIICPKLTGIVKVNCVSSKDEKAIISHYISNSHSELILIDMNHNAKQTYLTKKHNSHKIAVWSGIRFIDDKHVLCVTNHQCDFKRPVILNIDTLNISYFKHIETSIQWDYEHFECDDNDKYTYYTQNVHGYSELYRAVFTMDENGKNGVITDLLNIKLPFKGVISDGDQRSFVKTLSLNSNNNLLAFTMSNSAIPPTMFVINLENEMKCTQISNISTPGINTSEFVDSTLHSFKSFDSLEISYFRYKPINNTLCKNGGKYPALIIIHGGPESQYRPEFGYKGVIQFYIAAGFMIIAPNVRGSSGYGQTFMDADNVEKRMDSVKDVYELIKHLKQNDDDIDEKRLIVMGWSYGGFMVLSSITEYADLFVAAVDIVGISNFVTFLQNTADWRRPYREAEYGNLKNDMDVLKRISPIHKIDNIKCPLFIIQGDNDERVPLSESIQIYEKLKDKQLNTVLLRFDDEGHGVTKLKNKIVAYGQVLQWLTEIVK